jgi:tetratricopeptide (TPR) repeat protein
MNRGTLQRDDLEHQAVRQIEARRYDAALPLLESLCWRLLNQEEAPRRIVRGLRLLKEAHSFCAKDLQLEQQLALLYTLIAYQRQVAQREPMLLYWYDELAELWLSHGYEAPGLQTYEAALHYCKSAGLALSQDYLYIGQKYAQALEAAQYPEAAIDQLRQLLAPEFAQQLSYAQVAAFKLRIARHEQSRSIHRARGLLQEALAASAEAYGPFSLEAGQLLAEIARLARQEGNLAASAQYLSQACEVLEQAELRPQQRELLPRLYRQRASVEAARGQVNTLFACMHKALQWYTSLETAQLPSELAHYFTQARLELKAELADYYESFGKPEAALELYRELYNEHQARGNGVPQQATCLNRMAHLLSKQNAQAEAQRYYADAEALMQGYSAASSS